MCIHWIRNTSAVLVTRSAGRKCILILGVDLLLKVDLAKPRLVMGIKRLLYKVPKGRIVHRPSGKWRVCSIYGRARTMAHKPKPPYLLSYK